MSMRVHFWYQHIQNTTMILGEGNLPHPWFPLCDMLVPWRSLNRLHRCIAQCMRVTKLG